MHAETNTWCSQNERKKEREREREGDGGRGREERERKNERKRKRKKERKKEKKKEKSTLASSMAWRQEDELESCRMIQVRAHVGMNLGGGHGDDEKWVG